MSINKIIEKVQFNKNICIHSYDYQGAAEWRDIERYLNGLSIDFDISVIFERNSKKKKFNEILYLIKKQERKEKLEKLAKLQ